MAGAEGHLPLIATCLLHRFDEDRDPHLPTHLRTVEGEGEILPRITEEEWETDVCLGVRVHEDIQEVEVQYYGACLVEEVEDTG